MTDGAAEWIARLGLQAGPDGGFSREYHVAAAPGERRALLRVRYYLLTSSAPRVTIADALFFHHAGGRLQVRASGPAGERLDAPLGPPDAYQVVTADGWSRELELVEGDWALISAARRPGGDERSQAATGGAPGLAAGGDMLAHAMVPGRAGADIMVHELRDRSVMGAGPELRDRSVAGLELRDRSVTGAGPELRDRSVSGAGLIAGLGLRPHGEGGHFGERWRATGVVETVRGPRSPGSTIYYLLSAAAPIGHFHRNVSPITHLFHDGGPIVYLLLSPAGEWQEVVLGRDAAAGQVLTFTCPGDFFKSSHLPRGSEYGLISEIVAPGFDYADHTMADAALFERLFPRHRARWAAYVR